MGRRAAVLSKQLIRTCSWVGDCEDVGKAVHSASPGQCDHDPGREEMCKAWRTCALCLCERGPVGDHAELALYRPAMTPKVEEFFVLKHQGLTEGK